MDDVGDKKPTAPYISYATFKNFLERLRGQVTPERIDKSLMSTFSGAVQNQLISTLRFFDLIDANDIPRPNMLKATSLEGKELAFFWHELLTSSYPFIFNNGMDLKRATQNSLFECFTKLGFRSDTARKSMTFFIAAAESAGVELSPFLKKPRGPKVGVRRTRKPSIVEKQISSTQIDSHGGQQQATHVDPWLSKFPNFDPSWPDELKAKWFEGFKNLMDLKGSAKEGQK